MKCRICDTTVDLLEVVKGCRCEPVRFVREPAVMATAKMALYKCPCCSHIQAENQLPDTYYDDYQDNVGFAQYFGERREFGEKLGRLRDYAPDNQSFFEIGCGNGSFLELLRDSFCHCTGIEPSAVGSEIARKKGLHIIGDYFSRELHLENYSAFAGMMVFEHLEHPLELLRDIYHALKEGGVGLINVPNGQLFLENGYYHQIVLEHINYYTPFSLGLLAHKAGFQILEIQSADQDLELNIYVRKPYTIPGFEKVKQTHRERLQQLLGDKQKISIWGAGPKALVYSRLLGTSLPICHVLDSDPGKAGTYINGLPVPVELPTEAAIQESDGIVIFASSYNASIMRELREEYGYGSSIICFENNSIVEYVSQIMEKIGWSGGAI